MAESIINQTPLFDLRAELKISATPDEVYSLVSDMPRTPEWSREIIDGEWVSGSPAQVGAIFRGHNYREDDIVSWAPVPRGGWYTEAKIVAVEPGRTFRWKLLTHTREGQDSNWGYDMDPAPDGCLVAHHFKMTKATEGVLRIVATLDEAGRKRFVADWTVKLKDDMEETLRRIKKIVENQ
ncbi:SRPBCC family protein [Streptomyces sp. NPDC004647]|uniref:SRPBCC family protein n=1 Tax=Streptomyces sp. NPDC004647 TaxID=3154671 RepID=UPI0033B2D1E5